MNGVGACNKVWLGSWPLLNVAYGRTRKGRSVQFSVITPNGNIPSLLREDGVMKLLHAEELDRFPRDDLRVWAHLHGRYGLPTVELVTWLKNFIGSRKAIEIGSGAGDLCAHLGITGTDNWQQTWPDVRARYALMRQPVIRYPDFVEKYDAVEAVRVHRPDVVVGSWITSWIDPNLPVPPGGGNVYGVKEDVLLDQGVTYVLIGNLATHGQKPILSLPHEEHALPFIRSRALKPELDRVFIWHGVM